MVTMPIWKIVVYGLILGVGCVIAGAIIMRALYKKVLADKEARLASVLERMGALGEFIKDEILHVEPEQSKVPKE